MTIAATGEETGSRLVGFGPNELAWIAVILLGAAVVSMKDDLTWLVTYPEAWEIPLSDWVGAFSAWFVETFRPIFRIMSAALEAPMRALQWLLHALPWSVICTLFVLTAWQAGGTRTAVFTGCALGYIVVVGYWSESMNTLALVGLAIPLSIALGFFIGVAAHRSRRARAIVEPALDFMQTVPAFAYLIPILLLFGFGPVVGLIASAIFAIPPMVRNTMLGLAHVPAEIRESSQMCGCTGRQAFWWVDVPSAMPQLMTGFNQTTMAALSMVIIAAIIGGFDDIGWEVLSTMRKAQFGHSLLAGIVIALIAMILDRITASFSQRSRQPVDERHGFSVRDFFLVTGISGGSVLVLSFVIPPLRDWPDAWTFYPADTLNGWVTYITAEFAGVLTAIKNVFLFYFLLPIKLGLNLAVAPFTFGFSLTAEMKFTYLGIACAISFALLLKGSTRGAIVTMIAAGLLFYGTTGTPWPVMIAGITLLAYQAGGIRTALFVFFALLYILLTGLWAPAMLSVYLCGAAVALCVVLGVSLGVLASRSDRFSAFIRPVNDTLQTMPQFVLLIPILMFFQVGEFTALLAIMAYAIVPAIRYTEQGLRNVPATLIEAGRSMGCSPWQMFWQIKLPQALPVILLGINQTILFGLAMLVIAALVGTNGLGQQIYIALGKADAGMGLVAGVGMALIAMIADRILRAYVRTRQQSLGTA